jgi:hypothetical protein
VFFEVITRNRGEGNVGLSAVHKGFEDFDLAPDAPRFREFARPRRRSINACAFANAL